MHSTMKENKVNEQRNANHWTQLLCPMPFGYLEGLFEQVDPRTRLVNPHHEEGEYKLALSVAGVRQDDLRVTSERGLLHVAGRSTVGSSTFVVDRLYKLPDDANIDEATATHRDGLLTLAIPSHRNTPTRIRIERTVKASRSDDQASWPPRACRQADRDADSAHESVSGAVLHECEPDAANVQSPQEVTEEHAMPSPPETPQVGKDDAPLGGKTTCTEASMAEAPGHVVARPSKEGACHRDERQDEAKGSEEWDDLLADLTEMGFEDRQANRAALAKHAGSIKQVVKELVGQRALSE